MTKKIQCKTCKHIWVSNAKTLTAKGVYCRDCKGRILQWYNEPTGVEPKYKNERWENEDFLSQEEQEPSHPKSPNSGDTQQIIIPKNSEGEQLTKEEIRHQQIVDKSEQMVTKAGKKFNLRSTDDMIEAGLKMFEDFQNKRFEESGYDFQYGQGGNERVRNEMISAFQEAYGVSTAISPELAFWLYFTTYILPSGYHEVRYKSLGVRLKTWWSKFQANRKAKAVKKQEKKRKGGNN